jgi:hypothetical protein
MRLSFHDEESFKDVVGSLRFESFDNPPSDPNSVALALQEVGTSNNGVPPQERNEDICFNNSSSDLNSLGRVGSTLSQERSEDFDIIAA